MSVINVPAGFDVNALLNDFFIFAALFVPVLFLVVTGTIIIKIFKKAKR